MVRASTGRIMLVLGIISAAIVFVVVAVALNASGVVSVPVQQTQSYQLGYHVIGPHAVFCTSGTDGYMLDHQDGVPGWFVRDQAIKGCLDYKADLRVNTP